jgi:hypothetical protein
MNSASFGVGWIRLICVKLPKTIIGILKKKMRGLIDENQLLNNDYSWILLKPKL